MSAIGHNTGKLSDLKGIFGAARPLIEQSIDLTEQFAALRVAATEKGLDWGQIKALVKAQVLDERDESGEGKRIEKIIEKADYAHAYADMLGLAKMNENNSFPTVTRDKLSMEPAAVNRVDPQDDGLEIPRCLDRRPAP